ncbi:ARM repeat-containing protein [Trichoderma longibrachiatum ATCC 18648]|uniref:ARM repeat-containing protein n=1 Tax=Trichoderma longibrachiatum ATCC 18648 TaxID=983965 RepID=A0A2T4BU67_TRILO|nr:ARM repeat-containing protein [Trichoderma longibrachiatum ATCC 18648]
METTPAAKERNELFQKLKPCCVQVSQLAIRESGDPKSHRQVLQLVDQILDILNQQISTNPLALDEKLAEYVFFPLQHIFRQLERYPMNVVEECVKCLTILIVHGWKTKISAKLVQQIFSFLIFIIDGIPGSPKRDVPEETVLEAFRAETALLTTAGSSPVAAAGLSEPESIPALGHGITVMLDAVAEGASAEIQHEALRSLEAVYGAIKEHAALASFLPGTISSLAKVLSKPSRYKKLVLARCLETVRVVLTRVLSDMRTRSIFAKEAESQSDADKSRVLSSAWLKATVAQVQVALSVMLKLRTHQAAEVREALRRLCVALLDECHTTLANCTTILIETSVILDKGPDEDSMTETNLRYLINIYPELGESVKSTVYNWMSSLPRLVQASDERIKEQAVYNLTKGIELLRSLRIESSTLDDSISSTLRESLMAVVSATKEQQTNAGGRVLLLDDGSSASAASSQSDFQPVILGHEGQRRLKSEIMSLVRTVASTSQHTKIAANMLDCIRDSASLSQLTAYWLCFELVKASHAASEDTDALLDLSAFTDQSDDMNQVFDELYDFSVQVLDSHTEMAQVDWRLEVIALEIMAYAAQRSGESFRPELVDVLFPVATFLGSENANLQQHAITTLNSIALSCRYPNVSELIIDNVDYMVNTVSLRLNTLDISPASTQVLRMMVRLAGPRLVPFLDDVVESMFSALENYHGYTSFVESLFSVLKEIVDQASRADSRLLTDAEMTSINHKKTAQQMENLDMLLETLDRRKEREERDRAEMEGLEQIDGHLRVPWTSGSAQGQDEQNDQDQEMPPPEEEKKPNSPTYQLLQRVASLTQHYLTSPTPTLRRSLLELVTTASSVLAADQDAFLPLVNAIWPVIIARLHDPETFVVIEACEALSGLCKAAGDFLSTRWKTEWWDGLGNWCRKVKQQASGNRARTNAPSKNLSQSLPVRDIMIPGRLGDDGFQITTKPVGDQISSGGGGLGQYASPIRTWESVVKLLTAIVSYVSVEDDMFDEILELLAEAMERDRDVRDALEVINADAVWVVRYERGLVEWAPAPVMEGVVFPEMEKVS